MKYVSLILIVACGALSASAAQVDDPAPPTSPLSAMFSLEDIYNRLNAGTPGALRTGGFTNPTTGPIATRHTLNDVMAKAPAIDINGASSTQVLGGKPYWNLLGSAWGTGTGTMPNNGGVTITPSTVAQTIALGFHDGTGTVIGDANLLAANIKAGISIFGVSGTSSVVDTSSGTATAVDLLSGKTAFVNGSLITGNVPAGANVTGANGFLNFTIPNGLYSGNKVATAVEPNLLAANIKFGTSIFGVTGTAPIPSGTAAAINVLFGQTFSNSNATGITGTMPNNGGVTITPGTAAQTIAFGYHDGTGKVTGDANLIAANIKAGVSVFGVAGSTSVVDTASGTATAGDILAGKVAFVNGALVAGTSPAGANVTGTNGSLSVTIPDGHYSGSKSTTAVDANLVSGNIKAGISIFGVNGTANITGFAAPVAKTGQQNSYAAGDDGALQKGVTPPIPRFTDNSNGTVTDNLTGLIWLKNANAFGLQTWAQALNDCNSLASGSAGLTDGSTAGQWRLPNIREIQSLIDFKNYSPALPTGHPFASVQLHSYWLSTSYAANTAVDAYIVDMNGYNVSVDTKTNAASYVWPVRGGQ